MGQKWEARQRRAQEEEAQQRRIDVILMVAAIIVFIVILALSNWHTAAVIHHAISVMIAMPLALSTAAPK